jgi:DNA-binding transcriptional ArsR family regulator
VTAAVSPGHHPRHRIDPLLSAPVRLSIMAALAEVDAIEFGLLRDAVEVSDSVLSKQLSALQAAGYLVGHQPGWSGGAGPSRPGAA